MTAIDQIKRDEGLKLTPYVDTVGKVTIGYGTNLSDGIDKEEAEYLFLNRYNKKRIEVTQALPWITELSEPRQAVLLNMAYNLGVEGLLKFKNALALIKAGSYYLAAEAMLDSKWAKQVGQRALRLAEQMRLGSWV